MLADDLPDEDTADIRFELDKLEISEPCEVLGNFVSDQPLGLKCDFSGKIRGSAQPECQVSGSQIRRAIALWFCIGRSVKMNSTCVT